MTELDKTRGDNPSRPGGSAGRAVRRGRHLECIQFDELLNTVRQQAASDLYDCASGIDCREEAARSVFGETTHQQDFELRRLATETGGGAFFPLTIHELSGVYDDISNELAHQYALGYQSSNHALDGTFRRIALRIATPGVK